MKAARRVMDEQLQWGVRQGQRQRTEDKRARIGEARGKQKQRQTELT